MTTPRKPRGRPVPPRTPLQPGVYVMHVGHDDDCPTLRTLDMNDCTCTTIQEMLVQYGSNVGGRNS